MQGDSSPSWLLLEGSEFPFLIIAARNSCSLLACKSPRAMLPPRPGCLRPQVHLHEAGPWSQWLEDMNLRDVQGWSSCGYTSPTPLTLHTSGGSSLDRSVKGKVEPRRVSLLGESTSNELGSGNKQGAGGSLGVGTELCPWHWNHSMDTIEGNERK